MNVYEGNYTINMYGTTDDDYALFNVSRDVLPEADGWRTVNVTGNESVYEWWYFDMTLSDGAVITGTLSPYPNDGFVPGDATAGGYANFSYEKDGITRNEKVSFLFSEFSAAIDKLEVHAGPVTMAGDLNSLTIIGDVNGISLNVTFEQMAVPFRPGNGYVVVGSKSLDDWRGWFCAMPKGQVTGTLSLDGEEPQQITGIGYHDHNYGTVTAAEGTVGWLWAKVDTGRYVSLAVRMKYRQEFDGEIVNKVLWIYDYQDKKEVLRSIDGNGITVSEAVFASHPDPLHGGGYPTQTTYQYWVNNDKASVIFNDTSVLYGYLPYDVTDIETQQFIEDHGTNGLYYTRRNSEVELKFDIQSIGLVGSGTGVSLHELQESYFPQYISDK